MDVAGSITGEFAGANTTSSLINVYIEGSGESRKHLNQFDLILGINSS